MREQGSHHPQGGTSNHHPHHAMGSSEMGSNTNANNNNNGGDDGDEARSERADVSDYAPPPAPHPDQQYSLRWHEYQSNFLSMFRHLKDEEDFVDVTLSCDERSYKAHKVVLSACSPYFRKVLKANPCQHPIIILKDVSAPNLECLLKFMYNGEVNVRQEQLEDFLRTAQTLRVKGLAEVGTDSRPGNATRKERPDDNSWSYPQTNSDFVRPPQSPPPKRSRLEKSSLADGRGSPVHDRRESLLGQALGGTDGPNAHSSSSRRQSSFTGDDDDSSNDTAASDKLDVNEMIMTPKVESVLDYADNNDGMGSDNPGSSYMGSGDLGRHHPFPHSLLGLQGLQGFLPGPSGLQNNQEANYAGRRGLDLMRVRATDPRPCPKCGKIYRSAHTLRTHLEDKHTVCPGYRCVLCGTVAKSRNSLHSHMSRQHRGISTKDLPVLPMPSPFDPELAAKLLAKAGVKVSPGELAARASPTGIRRADLRLDLKMPGMSSSPSSSGVSITLADPPGQYRSSHGHHSNRGHHDDPQDLSVPNSRPSDSYHHRSSSHSQLQHLMQAGSAKSLDMIAQNLADAKAAVNQARGNDQATGSAILDTYLQYIAESSTGGKGGTNQRQHQRQIDKHEIGSDDEDDEMAIDEEDDVEDDEPDEDNCYDDIETRQHSSDGRKNE